MKYGILFITLFCFGILTAFSQTDSLLFYKLPNPQEHLQSRSAQIKASFSGTKLLLSASQKKNWDDVLLHIPGGVDFSKTPFLKFKFKTSANVTIRFDLVQNNNNKQLISNAVPISKSIQGNGEWNTIFFDFTGHFSQAWPDKAELDPAHIDGLSIVLNPGGLFTGEVEIDSLQMGRAARKPLKKTDSYVNVSQIGFFPHDSKIGIVSGREQSNFYVLRLPKRDTVLKDTLSKPRYWKYADEQIQKADFSRLHDTGTYILLVKGVGQSYPFKISTQVLNPLVQSSAKAFYYQRASIELQRQFAGRWARPLADADTAVLVHPSAADSNRKSGLKLSSPKGWYDAGDYNMYIVNSGVSIHSLLNILEEYPDYAEKINLNIPESKNAVPDLLDEILWNLRWMFTMQDPNDGGVYHKLTHTNFEPMVLPHLVTSPRYVVQKSTSAALDYTASMAQAARVFARYNKQLPGLTDSCIKAALLAWNWAKANPKVLYDQWAMNQTFKPEVYTGAYGDTHLADEFFWAASELYISTANDKLLPDITAAMNDKLVVPTWANVQMYGLFSLYKYRKLLAKSIDSTQITQKILQMAEPLRNYYLGSPAASSMGEDPWHFSWGSNSIALTLSIMQLYAYDITNDKSFLSSAKANFQYVLGQNVVGYSFVTGMGSKTPMFIHHRLTEGDSIPIPFPGLLCGGPQPGREDGCSYPFDAPAKTYTDEVCSYSTNEIAINWNAPLAYCAWALDALEHGYKPQIVANPRGRYIFPNLPKLTKAPTPQSTEDAPIIAIPNIAKGSLRLMLYITEKSELSITDAEGRPIATDIVDECGSVFKQYVVNFDNGVYVISLKNSLGVKTKKLIINK